MLIPSFKSNHFVQLVSIFDMLFALIVVAPLVVVFWATTWKIYDLFLLPNVHPILSGLVSFTFGCCGQLVLMFYQRSIKKLLNFVKLKFVNVLLLKMYALFLGHTFVSFWRGVWACVDATSPSKDLGGVILNIIQNIIILMILKVFKTALVPPFLIMTDSDDQYNMRTVLEKSKANGSFTYFVDCLATMFVEVLVAFVWHDFWFIHDYIFPHNLVYSASTSILIGYSLAVICLSVQSNVGVLCEKYDDKRFFIFEVFTTFCLLSAINVWRGVWTFVTYFAGDDKKWNLILNTIAWVSLMTLNCTFSLSAKDILKDAEISGRFCTKLQTKYFVQMLPHPQETDIKSDKV